jgi:hypothetical protein
MGNYLKEILTKERIKVSELQVKCSGLTYNTVLNIVNQKSDGNLLSKNKILQALNAIVDPQKYTLEEVFYDIDTVNTITVGKVFKKFGEPGITFVRPNEYNRLLAALSNHGQCLVIEGPSGVGKTTCIRKVIEELNLLNKYQYLSARNLDDIDIISDISTGRRKGFFIIDDIHRLDEITKSNLTNRLKLIADTDSKEEKIVILGINKVERSLFASSPDLVGRVELVKFHQNSEDQLSDLVTKGENALNIAFLNKNEIVKESNGSFHLLQMLCYDACLEAKILERQETHVDIEIDIEKLKQTIFEELASAFYESAKKIASGPNKNEASRAPYLFVLMMLSQSEDKSITLADISTKNKLVGDIINNLITTGEFKNHINENSFNYLIYFDDASKTIFAEDPKFIYYLRNLSDWNKFAQKCGFTNINFLKRYDLAFSFSGTERNIAEKLSQSLINLGISTFYDKNKQIEMLGGNIEKYLTPIYEEDSDIVVPIISKQYVERFWPRFESDLFKKLIQTNRVIPILVDGAMLGVFHDDKNISSISFDSNDDIDIQLLNIVDLLKNKVIERRQLLDINN